MKFKRPVVDSGSSSQDILLCTSHDSLDLGSPAKFGRSSEKGRKTTVYSEIIGSSDDDDR